MTAHFNLIQPRVVLKASDVCSRSNKEGQDVSTRSFGRNSEQQRDCPNGGLGSFLPYSLLISSSGARRKTKMIRHNAKIFMLIGLVFAGSCGLAQALVP
jgi:hypothetical protein